MCGGGGIGGTIGGVIGDTSHQSQSTTTGPWGPLVPYITSLLSGAGDAFKNPAGQGNQNAGFDMQVGAAHGAQQLNSTLLPGYNQMLAGVGRGDYLNPTTNPNWAGIVNSVKDPTLDALNRQILPGVSSAAQQQGAYGGSRQGVVESNSINDATRNIADSLGNVAWQNYGAERQAQLGLPSLLAGSNAASMAPGAALAGIGTQQQQAQQMPLQNFAQLLQMFLGAGGTSSTSASSTPSGLQSFNSTFGSGGAFGGGGGGTSAISGLSSLFSDVRLKSNIRRIGTHPSGLPWYSYQIFGGPAEGVMAHEAVTRFPGAVSVGPGGYLMVDYAKLGG